MTSAVVLLSAGLDSSFNLYKAKNSFDKVVALTFDYGQRAASKEKLRAAELCQSLGIRHQCLELPWFRDFTTTALVSSAPLARGDQVNITDAKVSQTTAKNVWVPNRNGIFLNIAAGFAEGLGADFVVPGFNREEAETFPDNSATFVKTLESCWQLSTASQVKIRCFSLSFSKTEIVKESLVEEVPLHKVWPCYLGLEVWCGDCESCLRYRRALERNGLDFNKLKELGRT